MRNGLLLVLLLVTPLLLATAQSDTSGEWALPQNLLRQHAAMLSAQGLQCSLCCKLP
jgi:hypothetical protein